MRSDDKSAVSASANYSEHDNLNAHKKCIILVLGNVHAINMFASKKGEHGGDEMDNDRMNGDHRFNRGIFSIIILLKRKKGSFFFVKRKQATKLALHEGCLLAFDLFGK